MNSNQIKLPLEFPHIHSFSLIIFDHVWAMRDHQTSHNELMLIVEGSVNLYMNDKVYPASKGDLLLVPEYTMHRDVFDIDTTFKAFMLNFEWPASESFFSAYDNSVFSSISEAQRVALTRMVNAIKDDLFEDESELNRTIANSRLYTVLALLFKHVRNQQEPKSNQAELDSKRNKRLELIKQARQYVEKNFSQMITLDIISQALNVSPHHLSHVFSQETNFSLFSYITSVRMENAKKRLMEGNMFISEVAETVGYNSESYFTKVFKKYFNNTPSFYQGANLKKERNA